MSDQTARMVRVERVRRQIKHGTYVTPERVAETAKRLKRRIDRLDMLWGVHAQGVRDQRAINELASK